MNPIKTHVTDRYITEPVADAVHYLSVSLGYSLNRPPTDGAPRVKHFLSYFIKYLKRNWNAEVGEAGK